MKYIFVPIAFYLVLLLSCKSNQRNKDVAVTTITDTILSLDSLNFFETGNPGILTSDLAHKTLIEYFSKRKYYYPEEKISLDSLLSYPIENEDLLMCIGFDTLYTVHLNNDKILDGIITYWEMPCGANGNNWRPHKAIITNIKNKYTIINTDLIPDYYFIDSISQDGYNTYINGKEFDREIREFSRSYRAIIKKVKPSL